MRLWGKWLDLYYELVEVIGRVVMDSKLCLEKAVLIGCVTLMDIS